jgi:hypothetical protein
VQLERGLTIGSRGRQRVSIEDIKLDFDRKEEPANKSP